MNFRRTAALILLMLLLPGLVSCGNKPHEKEDGPVVPPAPVPDDPPADPYARVREIVGGMTVEQKLAQMMIVALRSDPANTRSPRELTDAYKDLLAGYGFGGVILFDKNLSDIPQTVKLIRDCQESALASDAGIPMFIGIDQEGGSISRLPYGITGPGNMALGAAGDVSLTEEMGRMTGIELAALGINLDFAPVCDVNSNPNNPIIGIRSFSDDPDMVAEHAAAFMRGLADSGVCSVIKHFPGHGNVGEDSHTGLPRSSMTLSELEGCDLIPFASCAAAGADMIMTAHIQYPELEKDTYISKKDGKEVYLPATLSRRMITGLLREKMGYDGVVVTDSLVMGAITDHFDRTDAAAMAINAGADILLCPLDLYKDLVTDTFPNMDRYMQALAERVRSGEIPEKRLDESVTRILKLKQDKGILDATLDLSEEEQVKRAEETIGNPEHRRAEWDAAMRCITMLKNGGGVLPLDGKNGGRTVVLVPSSYRVPSVEYASRRLIKDGLIAEEFAIADYSGKKAGDRGLMKQLEGAGSVIILSQSSSLNKELVKIIGYLDEKDIPTVFISLGIPYDTAHYEEADAVICAYQPYGSVYDQWGDGPFGLNAAAALYSAFSNTLPSGRLPVNVPDTAPDGSFLDTLLFPRGFRAD